MRVDNEKKSDRWEFTIRKSNRVRIHHEKKSEGVRVHNEKKSNG